MNKKVLKVISVVMAIMMVVSTFSFVYAADSKQTKGIEDIVNTDDATMSSIETLINDYVKGYNERHSQPENQWMITLNGNQYDLLSIPGAADAIGNIKSTQQLKYVFLQYLEILAHEILGLLADTMPDPDYFKDEKDYKSENFYSGTDKFLDEPAEGAKWKLGYANASLVPDDWETKDYYLGGYIDINNGFSNNVESIVDDMKVRTVALDDSSGRGVSIFATIDSIGVSNAYIRQIRAEIAKIAAEKNIKLASVNVAATHSHSGIDTQGLWTNLFPKLLGNLFKGWTGLGTLEKGVDEDYMKIVVERTAKAMGVALDDMKPGTMTYSKKDIGDGYFNNKNRPSATAKDNTVTRLVFTPDDVNATPTIIANMAGHPDVAGLPTDDGKGTGRELCGEYVYYIEKYLNEYSDDSVAVNEGKEGYNFYFINGAIAGIYMGRGPSGDGYPNVHRYEESIRYGTEIGRILLALNLTEEEIVANDKISGDSIIKEEIEKYGLQDSYTIWYKGWTSVEETEVEPILNVRIKEIRIPVTNNFIKLAGRANLVTYNILRTEKGTYEVVSETGYIEIGKQMKAVTAPGEIVQDIIYGGGSITAEGSFSCQDFQYKSVCEIFGDKELTAFGLCNDALGYIVPDNDYSLISYHELISLGRYAASSIVGALSEIAAEVNGTVKPDTPATPDTPVTPDTPATPETPAA
ncbi:MAG: hypothetical protein IJ279_02255 [Clostridia bacterium]|nr:hypothetical protein [Clostridia bacterium]